MAVLDLGYIGFRGSLCNHRKETRTKGMGPTVTKAFRILAVMAGAAIFSGCAGDDAGRIARNSLFGVAESWCRSSPNCYTGGVRDPLKAPLPWENVSGRANDTPFRLPPLK